MDLQHLFGWTVLLSEHASRNRQEECVVFVHGPGSHLADEWDEEYDEAVEADHWNHENFDRPANQSGCS